MPRIAKIERKGANLALQANSCYNEAAKYCGVQAVRQYSWTDRKYEFLPMNDSIPPSSGIYKITCTANKRIYIGSAVNLRKRKNDHFSYLRQNTHGNPHMQNAWNKYGEQAFTFEILELVLPMSLTAREQYWFNKLKPFDRKGFNIAHEAGSSLGMKMSPEAIEKSRQGNLGKKMSPEARAKMSQAHLGKKQSPEHVEKRRQAHIGSKRSPEQIERNRQVHLGQKNSPETIEKIRQANLGRKASPEAVAKRAASNTGKKRSSEFGEGVRQRNLGKKLPPEHREKLRQANLGNTYTLGYKHTPEAKERMSQDRKGKPKSPEHRESMRQARIKRKQEKKEELT